MSLRAGRVGVAPDQVDPVNGKILGDSVVYPAGVMNNRELTDSVFEKSIISSINDLDDVKETGIYEVTTAPTHSPENASYYTLLVEAKTTNDIRQIAFVPKAAAGTMYMRAYGGNPAVWRSWFKFTGTIVS